MLVLPGASGGAGEAPKKNDSQEASHKVSPALTFESGGESGGDSDCRPSLSMGCMKPGLLSLSSPTKEVLSFSKTKPRQDQQQQQHQRENDVSPSPLQRKKKPQKSKSKREQQQEEHKHEESGGSRHHCEQYHCFGRKQQLQEGGGGGGGGSSRLFSCHSESQVWLIP